MTQETLALLSVVAASTSALVASFTLCVTVLAGVRNKKTDVLMECHQRFERLMIDKVPLLKKLASSPQPDADTEIDLRAWAQRFWSLQFDEYEWWRHGHVDTDTYIYWMLSRYRDLGEAKGGSSFGKHAFIDGWSEVERNWAAPLHIKKPGDRRKNFLDFMSEITTCLSAADVPERVKQHKPGWRQGLGLD